jgi:hypothetical protein
LVSQNERERKSCLVQSEKKEKREESEGPADFSLPLFMASSSNPPTGPAMASGDDSQNSMADAEATVVVAIDGESIDPSRFSPVPDLTGKTSFSLSLIPGMTMAVISPRNLSSSL